MTKKTKIIMNFWTSKLVTLRDLKRIQKAKEAVMGIDWETTSLTRKQMLNLHYNLMELEWAIRNQLATKNF